MGLEAYIEELTKRNESLKTMLRESIDGDDLLRMSLECGTVFALTNPTDIRKSIAEIIYIDFKKTFKGPRPFFVNARDWEARNLECDYLRTLLIAADFTCVDNDLIYEISWMLSNGWSQSWYYGATQSKFYYELHNLTKCVYDRKPGYVKLISPMEHMANEKRISQGIVYASRLMTRSKHDKAVLAEAIKTATDEKAVDKLVEDFGIGTMALLDERCKKYEKLMRDKELAHEEKMKESIYNAVKEANSQIMKELARERMSNDALLRQNEALEIGMSKLRKQVDKIEAMTQKGERLIKQKRSWCSFMN